MAAGKKINFIRKKLSFDVAPRLAHLNPSMRIPTSLQWPLVFAALLLLQPVLSAMAAIEDVRRLYDLTPVSTNNPVLMAVKECQIEIPLTEFRAYVNSS